MSEIQRIIDQLQRAFDGDAWSGPSLGSTLQGLSATQAATQALPTAHSIWEIVLHLTAWIRTVRQRIQEDRLTEISEAADWPPVPHAADSASWQQDLEALKQAHAELLTTVAQLATADLDRQLGASPNQSQGAGVSYYVMLH
jgi:uncharacterized damage-inducible protein DinB